MFLSLLLFFDLWVFSLFKSSMVRCNTWGCKESDMAEQLKNSRVQLFVTPWTVAYQAPPSMGFSRQEYWSGVPFPSPGDLPYPGIEPGSPVFQADSLTSELPGKPKNNTSRLYLALGNPGYDIKKKLIYRICSSFHFNHCFFAFISWAKY